LMIFMLMITHYLDTKDSMMKNTGLLKFGLSRGFVATKPSQGQSINGRHFC